MLKATSKARKQDLGLTIPAATRQARKLVDAAMPGVNATVESKFGYDLETAVATVITTITFPAGHPSMPALFSDLSYLPGRHGNMQSDSARIVLTRKR